MKKKLLIFVLFLMSYAFGCSPPNEKVDKDDTAQTNEDINGGNEQAKSLTTSQWKLAGVVDIETGALSLFHEQNCECYTLTFDTDSTFSTYAFCNELVSGIYKVDFENNSFQIVHFDRSLDGVYGSDLFTRPFCEKSIQSFSLHENELKLFFVEHSPMYLLFKSFEKETSDDQLVEPIVPDNDVTAFFEKHLPAISVTYSDCFLVDTDNKENICLTINDVDEFRNFFPCSTVSLPVIDFESYTLMVGRYRIFPIHRIAGQNLIIKSKKMELNIKVKIPDDGLVRVNNTLYIVENGKVYHVDMNMISVKPKSGYVLREDLIVIRSNNLGWHTIKVPENVDIEMFVSDLLLSDDFEHVEYINLGYWNWQPVFPLYYWGIYPKINNYSISINLIKIL